MFNNLKKRLNKLMAKTGYQLTSTRVDRFDPIIAADKDFLKIYDACKVYTMTSMLRCYALYQAVKYVIQNDISGDFVECGVWRGGSAMLIAMTAKSLGVTDRKIYLYDTFSGMSEPTAIDVSVENEEVKASERWSKEERSDRNDWCYANVTDVRNNLKQTDYPSDRFVLIEGKVEDTIPSQSPETIPLLRLDTDWYESTRHELEHLYPRLLQYGVLIIDDYGSWAGAKKAVDEYFGKRSPLLNRVDSSCRLVVKTSGR